MRFSYINKRKRVFLIVCLLLPVLAQGQESLFASQKARQRDLSVLRKAAKSFLREQALGVEEDSVDFCYYYVVAEREGSEICYARLVPNRLDTLLYACSLPSIKRDSVISNYCARIAQGIPVDEFFYVPERRHPYRIRNLDGRVLGELSLAFCRILLLQERTRSVIGSFYYLGWGFDPINYSSPEERLADSFVWKEMKRLGIEYFFLPERLGVPLRLDKQLFFGVDGRRRVYLFDAYRQEVTYVGGPPRQSRIWKIG